MTPLAFHFDVLASRQHGAAAGWQLRRHGLSRGQVDEALRGRRRIFRDVCADGDLDELGWFMAAALAYGPTGVISHVSALMLMELRPFEAHDIHVSYTGGGRRGHAGTVPHRRRRMETGHWNEVIPVTSPSQSIKDADLPPHEQYRAIETAQQNGHELTLPLSAVVRLRSTVRGTTRSDAEARLLLLVAEQGWPLPLVNHYLNGVEADFHWPHERLVVEVDGWEFHKEREQFEEDRRRTLVHQSAGWTVLRPSASQVKHQPGLVLGAIRQVTGW